jgi:PIN domain nuclease of toxin-antitoxin system
VILLLDAHALVWWLSDDPQLSQPARSAIADPANAVLVSSATVWELGIKHALGKLEIQAPLPEALERSGFTGVPITIDDGWLAGALPAHHRDPFDRMLVAQARRLDAIVISRDQAFRMYDVEVLEA